jgi:uncharacterized protein (DUF58 family)
VKIERTKVRLTNRAAAMLGGAVLLFGVGTNVQAGWVLVIAALLLGTLVAGIVLPLGSVRGIEVARHVPRRATAGQKVPVTISVTNTAERTRGLFRVNDDFCGPGWAVVDLISPHQTRDYLGVRERARRGVYTQGPITLETGAPFNVMRVRKTAVVESPIVVYPKIFKAPSHRLRGPSGWHAPAAVGDVSTVREYKPGDPLRHIHWRSVARRGKLMVREFDRERHADTTVVAEIPSDPDAGDAVASVACSLAIGALAAGEVALTSARAGAEGARTTERILEWGARLDAPEEPRTLSDGIAQDTAVIFVGPAQTREADRLADLASSTSVLAVLIADERGSGALGRLRSAGASVALLRPNEVEEWFSSGCAVA